MKYNELSTEAKRKAAWLISNIATNDEESVWYGKDMQFKLIDTSTETGRFYADIAIQLAVEDYAASHNIGFNEDGSINSTNRN